MILESVSRSELKVLRAAHDAIGKELTHLEGDVAQGCRKCSFFAASTLACIKHRAVMPIEFVSVGCDEWRPDSIPF